MNSGVDPGFIVAVAIWGVVSVGLYLVILAKGDQTWMLLGAVGFLFLPCYPLLVIGAVKIAEPSSWWAGRFYGPEKMERAYQTHRRLPGSGEPRPAEMAGLVPDQVQARGGIPSARELAFLSMVAGAPHKDPVAAEAEAPVCKHCGVRDGLVAVEYSWQMGFGIGARTGSEVRVGCAEHVVRGFWIPQVVTIVLGWWHLFSILTVPILLVTNLMWLYKVPAHRLAKTVGTVITALPLVGVGWLIVEIVKLIV